MGPRRDGGCITGDEKDLLPFKHAGANLLCRNVFDRRPTVEHRLAAERALLSLTMLGFVIRVSCLSRPRDQHVVAVLPQRASS